MVRPAGAQQFRENLRLQRLETLFLPEEIRFPDREMAGQDLEPVEGIDMAWLLRRRMERPSEQLSPSFVAEVGRQVCRGLDFAHTLTDTDGKPLSAHDFQVNRTIAGDQFSPLLAGRNGRFVVIWNQGTSYRDPHELRARILAGN